MDVRVRFAPSPTGFFHIGSARTALFNWLYARHTGGTFVLRIEDTDKERNSDAFLKVIYDSMKWLGMDWDEGPGVGGKYGPYLQSQRGDIYKKHIANLLAKGRAYEKDGAIWLRLEGERKTVFDDFEKKEVEKVSAPPVAIDDIIRGHVERAEDRDFVIVRSNGEPVFHLVNVIDDIEMGITHVIRGEDHLSNTSKHVLIFKALDASVPQFAHMPLILKDPAVGKGKMSKRDKGALIEEYQTRGFYPEAVRNFLCLLGWSPKDDREKMDIAEVIRMFELTDIMKAGAHFDERKMLHLNSLYLRSRPLADFVTDAKSVLAKAGYDVARFDEASLADLLKLCQEKIFVLDDLPGYARFFFDDAFEIDAKAVEKIGKKENIPARLAKLLPAFTALEKWDDASIRECVEALGTSGGEKPYAYFSVLRLAVCGTGGGPELHPILRLLGRERVLKRLADACAKFPVA
jgi:glutamyl-tRNA synthetase